MLGRQVFQNFVERLAGLDLPLQGFAFCISLAPRFRHAIQIIGRPVRIGVACYCNGTTAAPQGGQKQV